MSNEFEVTSIHHDESVVRIQWASGDSHDFQNLWLRDSCRCSECFQDTTLQRNNPVYTLADLPQSIKAEQAQVENGDQLGIVWENGHKSSFPLKWLKAQVCAIDNVKPYTFWPKDFSVKEIDLVNVHDYTSRLELMRTMETDGVAIINNVPKNLDGLFEFANLIGPQEQYRDAFHFTIDGSDPAPKKMNVGFQNDRQLRPHTDRSPYPDGPTRYMCFLSVENCYSETVNDGYNTLLDGFKIAETLRTDYPEYYDILKKTDIPSGRRRGLDLKHPWITYVKNRLIETDENDAYKRIIFAENTRAPLDPNTKNIPGLILAYNKLVELTLDEKNQVAFPLKEGQILLLDNWRILHGRHMYQDNMKRIYEGVFFRNEIFLSRHIHLLSLESELSDKWLSGCSKPVLEYLSKHSTN